MRNSLCHLDVLFLKRYPNTFKTFPIHFSGKLEVIMANKIHGHAHKNSPKTLINGENKFQVFVPLYDVCCTPQLVL